MYSKNKNNIKLIGGFDKKESVERFIKIFFNKFDKNNETHIAFNADREILSTNENANFYTDAKIKELYESRYEILEYPELIEDENMKEILHVLEIYAHHPLSTQILSDRICTTQLKDLNKKLIDTHIIKDLTKYLNTKDVVIARLEDFFNKAKQFHDSQTSLNMLISDDQIKYFDIHDTLLMSKKKLLDTEIFYQGIELIDTNQPINSECKSFGYNDYIITNNSCLTIFRNFVEFLIINCTLAKKGPTFTINSSNNLKMFNLSNCTLQNITRTTIDNDGFHYDNGIPHIYYKKEDTNGLTSLNTYFNILLEDQVTIVYLYYRNPLNLTRLTSQLDPNYQAFKNDILTLVDNRINDAFKYYSVSDPLLSQKITNIKQQIEIKLDIFKTRHQEMCYYYINVLNTYIMEFLFNYLNVNTGRIVPINMTGTTITDIMGLYTRKQTGTYNYENNIPADVRNKIHTFCLTFLVPRFQLLTHSFGMNPETQHPKISSLLKYFSNSPNSNKALIQPKQLQDIVTDLIKVIPNPPPNNMITIFNTVKNETFEDDKNFVDYYIDTFLINYTQNYTTNKVIFDNSLKSPLVENLLATHLDNLQDSTGRTLNAAAAAAAAAGTPLQDGQFHSRQICAILLLRRGLHLLTQKDDKFKNVFSANTPICEYYDSLILNDINTIIANEIMDTQIKTYINLSLQNQLLRDSRQKYNIIQKNPFPTVNNDIEQLVDIFISYQKTKQGTLFDHPNYINNFKEFINNIIAKFSPANISNSIMFLLGILTKYYLFYKNEDDIKTTLQGVLINKYTDFNKVVKLYKNITIDNYNLIQLDNEIKANPQNKIAHYYNFINTNAVIDPDNNKELFAFSNILSFHKNNNKPMEILIKIIALMIENINHDENYGPISNNQNYSFDPVMYKNAITNKKGVLSLVGSNTGEGISGLKKKYIDYYKNYGQLILNQEITYKDLFNEDLQSIRRILLTILFGNQNNNTFTKGGFKYEPNQKELPIKYIYEHKYIDTNSKINKVLIKKNTINRSDVFKLLQDETFLDNIGQEIGSKLIYNQEREIIEIVDIKKIEKNNKIYAKKIRLCNKSKDNYEKNQDIKILKRFLNKHVTFFNKKHVNRIIKYIKVMPTKDFLINTVYKLVKQYYESKII